MVEPVHVSHADAPPARRRRGWRVVGIVLAGLVLVVAACEVAGWPFLVGPAERMLSRVLDREVLLSSEDAGGAHVRFFGGVKATAPVLQIAAPQWSEQPFFLRAENARMHLSYGALLRARRGEPLDIALLHAERLTVNAERRADGTASWQFGEPDPEPSGERSLPRIGELVLGHGELHYVDETVHADLRATVQTDEGSAAQPDAAGLRATVEGRYDKRPLRATLQAAGALPLLSSGENVQPTPVRLKLEAGEAVLDFDGRAADVLRLHTLAGEVEVKGASLGGVGRLFGVTLPTTGPFALKGRIAKDGGLYNFVADDARVADSRLRGALTFDTAREPSLLSGRVGGARLVLADLAPSVGARPTQAPPGKAAATRKAQQAAQKRRREAREAAAEPTPPERIAEATGAGPNPDEPTREPQRRDSSRAAAAAPDPAASAVLPRRDFDLPALRAMDANVLLDFARVDLGDAFATPLQPLKAHLRLTDGRLAITDIDARTADGSVAGTVTLDGAERVAQWRADLRLSDVRLERWLRQNRGDDGQPWVAGLLSARLKVTGRGRSTADMLATLDGNIGASMRDARVSHLIVEVGGIDIAQALGVVLRGDDMLPVNCAAADIVAKNGVLTPRALLIDTPDSMIVVDGRVSLTDETLDLRLTVSPKDFSPATLRTPVHVTGPFSAPEVELEKGPLGRKLAASILLGLINPLAALIPLLDPGEGALPTNACASLAQRARNAVATAGGRK